jgi:PiT family inorganic phosphate transporter
MDLYFYLSIGLEFLLAMFVSGNNLSAAVGTLVGSKIISRAGGILIGAAGFSSGFLLEGRYMNSVALTLLPHSTYLITILFSIVIVIFVVAQILKSPLSLSMALVGTAVGISLRVGSSINTGYLELLLGIWIISPVVAIVLSYLGNLYFGRFQLNKTWNMASALKVLLLLTSAFTAYTLGANTIGLLGGFAGFSLASILSVLAGIVVGSTFLSAGVLKRVGEEMYSMRYFNALISLIVSSFMVEGATLFSFPLSNTQTLTSGVFGAGLSYRYKALFVRPYLVVVITWIVSPLIGMFLGFLL